ncbi:Protein lap4 [Morus notabilis]|uniref:Protein lap4 n=1 Tax=Morus notabilis TaxID=981085 RepID=W9RNK1_9ROSA|nr:plant intracellular Ras-group-related LRR protein 5 [Morus notabilis]EXB99755.1 Protein lap4 [Morus notabilis]
MAVIPEQVVETVEEIMRAYKSLPPRPTIEEVEAATSVVKSVEADQQAKLDEISRQQVPKDVPQELFSILQQVRRKVVLSHSYEQKREAVHVIELDRMFQIFDDLIQRASGIVSGDNQAQKRANLGAAAAEPVEKVAREVPNAVIGDESLVAKKSDDYGGREVEKSERNGAKALERSSSAKASFYSGDNGKLSLMKVAALIENTAKSGSVVLDLKGKLTDQMEWLPVSIGKLSDVTELDLSENRILSLPPTICRLRALTKLDIHSNQLINLPDSFGDLINLTDLDLHANRLRSLPDSFGNLKKLINLDLSSNELTHLPEITGHLTSLKSLSVETNELEELPYSIGSCTMLLELRLDFNQLRALPEAIGKLVSLEILSLHYNRIKGLPTTIGNLTNLKELDVSFNELESVPENLCFATSLRKLNVGKNFADLRSLPRSIGNLEMLEELDISDDQITVLPDSFRFLLKLRVFRADETPLEIPPRHVTKLGAQAVVQFMSDYVAKRDSKTKPLQKKGSWFMCCIKPRSVSE